MPYSLFMTILLVVTFEKIRCENNNMTEGIEIIESTSCLHDFECNQRFGSSVCQHETCVCKIDTYVVNGTQCVHCSDFQKNCSVSKCCKYSKYTMCIDGICKCKQNHNEPQFTTCWRHIEGTQNILSFAKLVLGAILALSLAALFGILKQLCNRPESLDSTIDPFPRSFAYESFNSIQRYVMNKLKDRPPRYEDIQKDGSTSSPNVSSTTVNNNLAPTPRLPSYENINSTSPPTDISIPPPPYTPSAPPDSAVVYETLPLNVSINESDGVVNPCFQPDGVSTNLSTYTQTSSTPPVYTENTVSTSKSPPSSQSELVLSPRFIETIVEDETTTLDEKRLNSSLNDELNSENSKLNDSATQTGENVSLNSTDVIINVVSELTSPIENIDISANENVTPSTFINLDKEERVKIPDVAIMSDKIDDNKFDLNKIDLDITKDVNQETVEVEEIKDNILNEEIENNKGLISNSSDTDIVITNEMTLIECENSNDEIKELDNINDLNYSVDNTINEIVEINNDEVVNTLSSGIPDIVIQDTQTLSNDKNNSEVNSHIGSGTRNQTSETELQSNSSDNVNEELVESANNVVEEIVESVNNINIQTTSSNTIELVEDIRKNKDEDLVDSVIVEDTVDMIDQKIERDKICTYVEINKPRSDEDNSNSIDLTNQTHKKDTREIDKTHSDKDTCIDLNVNKTNQIHKQDVIEDFNEKIEAVTTERIPADINITQNTGSKHDANDPSIINTDSNKN